MDEILDRSDVQALELAQQSIQMLYNYLYVHAHGENHNPWNDRELTNSRNELRDCISKAKAGEVKAVLGDALEASGRIKNDKASLEEAMKRLKEIYPKVKEMKTRYEDEFETRRNGMNSKNASVEMARKLLKMAKTLVAGGKGKAYCQHNGETYELQCAVTIEESSDCTMSQSTFFVTNEVIEAYKAFTFPPNVYRAGLVVKGHKAFAYFSLFSADDKEWLIEQANELGYELVDDYGVLFD